MLASRHTTSPSGPMHYYVKRVIEQLGNLMQNSNPPLAARTLDIGVRNEDVIRLEKLQSRLAYLRAVG